MRQRSNDVADLTPSERALARIAALSRGEEELDLAALLRLPYQLLVERLHEDLAARGFPDIRVTHGKNILAHVDERGVRIVDLAEAAQLTKQSTAELVLYLEQRGYVTRTDDPLDGRAKLIHLTDRGVAAHGMASTIIQEISDEWAECMGTESFERLLVLLRQLIRSLLRERGD